MNVLDFIEADIGRSNPPPALRAAAGVALILFGVALAFALRDDFAGVFTWAYLAPSVLMGPALAAGVWGCLSPALPARRRWALVGGGAAAMLGLSFVHPAAPAGFADASAAEFWQGTARCFGKGLLAGGFSAVALTWVTFRWLPVPGWRWQLACGLVSGTVGVLMLNLHCPSREPGHVVLGHWGQGLPLLLAVLAAQRWLFRRAVAAPLGLAARRLRRLGRLG